jgi:hypothetical protein
MLLVLRNRSSVRRTAELASAKRASNSFTNLHGIRREKGELPAPPFFLIRMVLDWSSASTILFFP